MQAGLTQIQFDALEQYSDSDAFTEREKLALTYAERITLSEQDIDDELFTAIQAEFDHPAAIVELTAMVAFENFRSKFNHALLVDSNGVCMLAQRETFTG